MELVIRESFEVFKNFIGLLKTVNEEMPLKVTEDGIKAMSMDPSHICMINATMKPELVDSFTAPEKEEILTINLVEMTKFLDRIGKDERVKINYDAERAKLVINSSKGGYRRRFTMPILEPMDEEVPEPKIRFKASGRILTQAVRRAIRDADLVAEHIKLEVTSEQLKFSASGDLGSTYSDWEKGSDELLELKAEEEASATFTLSYLKDIFNALSPLTDVVIIEASTDMPIKIKADAIAHIEVELYLAPCIM